MRKLAPSLAGTGCCGTLGSSTTVSGSSMRGAVKFYLGPRDQEDGFTSYSMAWRERKQLARLYGFKCKKCGTAQFPQRRICVEDEEIAATLGHPFWGSGDGWRMAKELKSGQLLHALDGSWPIRQVDELPDAEAYNLVVDDFHTYFVGRAKILTHDNTIRRPTTCVVPGLTRQTADTADFRGKQRMTEGVPFNPPAAARRASAARR